MSLNWREEWPKLGVCDACTKCMEVQWCKTIFRALGLRLNYFPFHFGRRTWENNLYVWHVCVGGSTRPPVRETKTSIRGLVHAHTHSCARRPILVNDVTSAIARLFHSRSQQELSYTFSYLSCEVEFGILVRLKMSWSRVRLLLCFSSVPVRRTLHLSCKMTKRTTLCL